ncbi:AraC family transcriptional regulator [Priestia megaterium]|nr:AraC family transcriptional regulator [Priestia megaterium]
MHGKIVYKEGFSVIGIAQNGAHHNKKDEHLINRLWDQMLKKTNSVPHKKHPHIVTGICIPPNHDEYFYIAGVEALDATSIPKGMSVHTFPSFTYIQYRHIGSIQQLFLTYEKIWNQWLPQSGYELVDGPTLEVAHTLLHPDLYSHTSEMDIYIPIKIGQ